jgi:4-carboxymuconolactone decarboxylase
MPARKPRPTSPRIVPVTTPSVLQQELMFGSGDTGTLNISATLAHNTRVLKRFSQMGGTLLFRGELPVRERELVILRVGANAESVYEFGQHTVIGLESGITQDEVLALTLPLDQGSWSDEDRDLLLLADELCADDCVSDETWARLATRFPDSALVELVVVAGFYRMVSGFLNSAGVQLDAGVPGWPEGAFGQ